MSRFAVVYVCIDNVTDTWKKIFCIYCTAPQYGLLCFIMANRSVFSKYFCYFSRQFRFKSEYTKIQEKLSLLRNSKTKPEPLVGGKITFYNDNGGKTQIHSKTNN